MNQPIIPDWTGETVAIIASGPSTKKTDISELRGKSRIIAIKENIDLCPWADIVYGCDGAWWLYRRGLPNFSGLKFAWEPSACNQFKDLVRVEIEKLTDRLLLEKPLHIGSGGNSGFQALNLAVQFGVAKIILIGFDMTDRPGVHWYGRNTWPMANNPDGTCFPRWIRAFITASEQLRSKGIDVINASPISDLKCFPRRSIPDAMKEWACAA